MNKPLHYAVLLCAFSAVCCRVAHRTDSFNGRRIRHGSSANEGTRGGAEPSESEMLAQVQADILAGLGITEEMLGSRQAAPEYAAQLAVREAQARDQAIDQTDSGEHFMEGSSNLLLISRKVHTSGYGETMQFHVNADDRNTRMSEVKLYYYINAANITMTAGREDEMLSLRLAILSTSSDGTVSARVLQTMDTHRHLMGWHSQQIPTSVMRELLSEEVAPVGANVTINFQLTCTNCIYQAFPEVITKENVPFLKVEGRRRTRRNGGNRCTPGGCCLKELIVDFDQMGPNWEWVLRPRRYIANYCLGSCSSNRPAVRGITSSNTHVVNGMLAYLGSGRVSSCCVPQSEEFRQFVYTDMSGAIRSASNIIRTVNSCKCA